MTDENRLLFTRRDLEECRIWINKGRSTQPMRWWFEKVHIRDDGKFWWCKQDLTKLYNNPKITGGRDRIYSYLKEKVVGVSRRAVMDYLKSQKSYQL